MLWEWGGQDVHFALFFILDEDAFINTVLDQMLQDEAIFSVMAHRSVELAVLFLKSSP